MIGSNIPKNKNNCTGCAACFNVCPVSAIIMKENAKGFRFPEVNQNLCINCNKCQKVCPTYVEITSTTPEKTVYQGRLEDDEKLLQSSSGGAFTALAEYFLNNKGIVYGVSLDKELQASYKRVSTLDELVKLKGSKYVEPEVNNIFNSVIEDLALNKEVLFSGTPCVISGLLSVLQFNNINTINLVTCDILCHGVNSPEIYNDYLLYLKDKFDFDNNKGYTFRDKIKGWRTHGDNFFDSNGKLHFSNYFITIFLKDLILRDSCYDCKYTNLDRITDITIGDFWGIEKVLPELDDNKGSSILLLNTNKGKALFKKISGFKASKISINECMQPVLIRPTTKNSNYDSFWEYYKNNEFSKVINKYGKKSFIYKSKRKVKNLIKLIIKI